MTAAADYSFARRPVWLIGHLVAVVAIVGFTFLGLWQLDRHADRSRFDAALESRLGADPVPLETLLGSATVSANEYRPVIVSGRYLSDEEVILQARSLDGRSGHEVLTPMLLEDGTAVIVNRGWVPIDVAGPPVAEAAPPAGEVKVVGLVRQTQVRSGLGPVDPPQGDLERISRVDIARLQHQIEPLLQEVWVQLRSQEPSQSQLPLPSQAPEPGGGPPHLSYAVQWFAFAAVVAVSYPVLMYRTARRASARDG